MSKKTNGVNHSMRVPVKSRRARVLEKLEAQLLRGDKTEKLGKTSHKVPLTEKDIKRINSEIATLKKRV
jgi:hypothetical protein